MAKLSDYQLLNIQNNKSKVPVDSNSHQDGGLEDYPKNKTVHQLFKEVARAFPDKIALTHTLPEAVPGMVHAKSYKALDDDSDQIAHFLLDRGLQTEETVGLIFDQSIDQITALLGILKAGGVYMSLHPDLPFERLKGMVRDAGAKIVISQKKYIKLLNKLQWECEAIHTIFCIDSDDIYAEEEPLNELGKKDLWDYVGEEATDDISGGGWLNSYTGEKLSREVMDEYGDNILQKLKPLLRKDDKVLEIGCSSGISMFRLAPLVHAYYGTDLSGEILQKTKIEADKRGIRNLHLSVMPAHQIDTLGEKRFRVVILNSVIQCFHGLNYFRNVLAKALDLMEDDGIIFLGDLMDQDKKDALNQSLLQFKKNNQGKGFVTKVDWTHELFISRKFLDDLPHRFPAITNVVHSEKIHTLPCELTEFRYDTLLSIQKKPSDTQVKDNTKRPNKYQYDRKILAHYRAKEFPEVGHARQLAYVSFTSGTTGTPKGVLIEHRSVVRLVRNTNYINISHEDQLTQTAPISFDAATFEIWGALLNGAGLHLVDKTILFSPEKLHQFFQNQGITICWLTSSLFNFLVNHTFPHINIFSPLKVLLVGGDVLSPSHINRVIEKNPQLKVINGYGPTENTTFSACYPITQKHKKSIPIGKPIAYSQCFILDEQLTPVATGMSGELYVAGEGLARGYLNDPELTAEKFIKHPTLEERLYKTGDHAKWLPDGNIHFLGRKDDQIKIRGYRVELEEIAQKIKDILQIEEVLVLSQKDPKGDTVICAYIASQQKYEADVLKDELSMHLPAYMIPAFIIFLDAFPLNAHGKIDKKALPAWENANLSSQDYFMPRNEVEKKLAEIWRDVLGISQIGIEENFFRIGGHSLKATQVVSRAKKELKANISIREVFAHPTIKALSQSIIQKAHQTFEAIPVIPEQAYYALSHAQKRLWILDQFEEERLAYHIPGAVILEGLDPYAFEKALETVVARHESLRTTFVTIDEEPMQKVQDVKDFAFKIVYTDVRGKPQWQGFIPQLAREEAHTLFDLAKGPLVRAKLWQLADHTFLFLITMHHIISDGWSLGVLVREIITLYNAYVEGQEPMLGVPGIQYKDYAAWQNDQLSGEKLQLHQQYWWHKLGEGRTVLELPADYPRPSVKTSHGDRVHFLLPHQLTQEIHEFSQQQVVSIFMTLLATLKVLLYKYTGQQDIIIGSPIAGRGHQDLEDQIGFYINTLALRTNFSGEDTFHALLQKVKQTSLEAYEHQVYPFDRLVDDLVIERDLSRSPLFDVMMILQNTGLEKAPWHEMKGVSIEPFPIDYKLSQFDLTFHFNESPEGIHMVAEYNCDLFKKERIENLLKHYGHLLQQLIHHPHQPISRMVCVLPTEQAKLVQAFNRTARKIPAEETLLSWFEAQVNTRPDAHAVEFENTVYTYRALDQVANQFACLLREKYAVAANDLIGTLLHRSEKMLPVLLGIMKAGAGYVPIDPEFPNERIEYLLEDSQVKVLVADTSLSVSGRNRTVLDMDTVWKECTNYPAGNAPSEVTPQQVAYTIYTSGSTGKPKGVMIRHRSLLNFLMGMQQHLKLQPEDRWLAVTTYSFDISLLELFLPITQGATVMITTAETVKDPGLLAACIKDKRPTIMQATPSLWNMLLQDEWKGDQNLTMVCGGEKLPPEVGKALLKVGKSLWNVYGPTETTIWSTIKLVQNEVDLKSIGKPIQNTEIYILDRDLQLLPVGVPGDVYIGGEGLAMGYLNRPELTHEKFVPNPFQRGKLMYKTGDIAQWLPEGEIAFIGRKDNQVKVRGFRIELGEIETTIAESGLVDQAVVITRPDPQGECALVAYLTGTKPEVIAGLRQFLERRLPAYMIPNYFVSLEALPLTPNRKIDRKALSELPSEPVSSKVPDASPANEMEAKLLAIWQEVLGRENIGIHDHFFEIGGHSLKATQIVSRIFKELHLKIQLKDVFNHPKIVDLGDFLSKKAAASYETIPLLPQQAYYDLSHAQKRLWLLDQFEGSQAVYQMPIALKLEGKLDVEAFEKALLTMVQRHESLRTNFVAVQGEPKQKIHHFLDFNFQLQHIDLKGMADAEEKAKALSVLEIRTAFDLSQDPLIRAKLLYLDEQTYVFLLTIHHIIADGWSTVVILHEIITLYQAFLKGSTNPLPPLTVQYKDFAAWQNDKMKESDDQTYWLKKLQNNVNLIDFTYDFIRQKQNTFEGVALFTRINAETTAQLKALAQQHGISLSTAVLSIFHLLLHHLTGQKETSIALTVANRNVWEIENLIGFFVNMLITQVDFRDVSKLDDLFALVNEEVTQAFEHQNYPFDLLVQDLNPIREGNYQPLFNVAYSFQNQEDIRLSMGAGSIKDLPSLVTIPGLKVTNFAEANRFFSSRFDLLLFVNDVPDGLLLTFEYNGNLFRETTVQNYLKYFKNFIETSVGNTITA